MHRYVRLGAALSFMATAPLSAQLAPIGVPKGTLRVDFGGSFESADQRIFGVSTEDYLADFGSHAFGADRLPQLRAADSLLSVLTGQPGSRLNLGTQRANGQLTIGTGTINASLGVTRRLTLFANVPLVTTRVQARLRLDTTVATAGLNTAAPGLGNGVDQNIAQDFFNRFTQTLDSLQKLIGSLGALDPLAQSIYNRGTALRDQLEALTNDPVTASPFLPTSSSAAGQQILAKIHGLQDTLANTLGVSGFGFTIDPFLPQSRVSDAQFAGMITNPTGPFAALPLAEAKISRAGDMDVGAAYTLIDRFDRPGTTGGLRFVVSGLLRLPTGQRDNPNNYWDVGTGNGRYEVGVSGTADLGAGRWGTRLTGGYLVRLAALRVRRVTSPDEPYPTADRLTNVRFNAGDILSLGAKPFYRLARNIALHGQVDFQRIGSDRTAYDRRTDIIAGLNPNALSEGQRSALAVGGGVSYVGRGAHECEPGRRCGWPIEASWNYTSVVHGTGGRVAKFRTTRLEIRWYQRIWR